MSTDPATSDRLEQAKRHLRHGELDEAIAGFAEILNEDSTCVAAHEGLGATCFAKGELERAAEHFSQITRLAPQNGNAYINLGAIYNRLGDYRAAADALRRGLQKSRHCSQGYYNLGIAQKHLGQPGLAVTAYREAIRLDSQMVDAHLNLANLYLEMGNYSQALVHYRQALELKPNFGKARAGIAEAQAKQEQSRKLSSPLGRLVDAEAPPGESAATAYRQLSDAERRADRSALQQLTEQITAAAIECRDDLKEALEPSLLALTRTVAADTSRIQRQQVHEQFQQALQQTAEARAKLEAEMRRLRQHEEQMQGNPAG